MANFEMTTIRGYFEQFQSGNPFRGSLRRLENGEYYNQNTEEHWQTFQEGWASAVEYLLQAQNENS